MKKLLLKLTLSSIALLMPMTSFAYGDMCHDECCNDPCSSKCKKFTVSADYLYWNTCRSNLNYGSELENINEKQFIDHNFYVHDKWNSGFRINAIYSCKNEWDMNARFTWYRDSAYNETLLSSADLASGSYILNYKVLDVDMGSSFTFRCDTHIRPFAGVKFAWIDDKLDTILTGGLVTPQSLTGNHHFTIQTYGPVVGLDFKHHFNKCFDLIAKVAFGAHYGDVDIELIFGDVDTSPSYVEFLDHTCRLMYSSEFAIGIERSLCNFCGSDLLLSVGYELQAWNNLTEFAYLIDTRVGMTKYTDATLILHGLFVRLTTSF